MNPDTAPVDADADAVTPAIVDPGTVPVGAKEDDVASGTVDPGTAPLSDEADGVESVTGCIDDWGGGVDVEDDNGETCCSDAVDTARVDCGSTEVSDANFVDSPKGDGVDGCSAGFEDGAVAPTDVFGHPLGRRWHGRPRVTSGRESLLTIGTFGRSGRPSTIAELSEFGNACCIPSTAMHKAARRKAKVARKRSLRATGR